MENLEKRMYFFVPYNISPIQQAIQAGHAALEYAHKFGHHTKYIDYVENWKTWIILNGGTTNSNVAGPNGLLRGTLNQIREELSINDIDFSDFWEPDLDDALTAVCFICDERVWDDENYQGFDDWFCVQDYPDGTREWQASYVKYDPGKRAEAFPNQYKLWESRYMGGSKNVFLRELLKDKRLA